MLLLLLACRATPPAADSHASDTFSDGAPGPDDTAGDSSAVDTGPASDTDNTDDTEDTDDTATPRPCGFAGVEPGPYARDVARDADVTVDVGGGALAGGAQLVVIGETTGTLLGTTTWEDGHVRFTPADGAHPGERVTAVLTAGASCPDGAAIPARWWTWTAAADPAAGTLTRVAEAVTGDYTYEVAAGDLDGDGAPEVVSLEGEGDTVTVLGGDMAVREVHAVAGFPVSLALADLDADGDLDVPTITRDGGALYVLDNDGAGGLTVGTELTLASEPWRLRTGDLDLDGDLDLVVGHGTGTVTFAWNDGAGGFTLTTTEASGVSALRVELADVDGDYDPDVLVPLREDDRVDVLLNAGDGTFSSGPPVRAADGPWDIHADDLDGDADVDLVVLHQWDLSITVHAGDGVGGFPRIGSTTVAGGFPHAVDGGDLDGDGDVDLAVAAYFVGFALTYDNDGAAGFATVLNEPLERYATAVDVADLDGDGVLEVLIAETRGHTDSRVAVYARRE